MMSAFSRVRLTWLLPLLLLLLPQISQAAPKLQLQPVELLGYQGDDLKVRLELPCGSRLYGILARLDAGKRMKVAAVVEQDNIICTSYPEAVDLRVDFLATTGVDEISALPVNPQRNRVSLLSPSAIQTGMQPQDGVSELKVAYEQRCGEPLGTIVRRTGVRKVEIAIAESPTQNPSAACSPRARVSTIRSLAFAAGTQVVALERAAPNRSESLRKLYELRFADVKPGSIARQAGTGLSLTYRRACNEAPVGIVVDGSGVVARVGMLVARYRNHRCSESEPGFSWDTHSNLDVALSPHAALAAMGGTETVAMRITAPSKLARKQLRYVSSCERPLGTVMTQDDRGLLALGVIVRDAPLPCKSAPAEVSLKLPFVAKHVQTRDMVPLKLRGRPVS